MLVKMLLSQRMSSLPRGKADFYGCKYTTLFLFAKLFLRKSAFFYIFFCFRQGKRCWQGAIAYMDLCVFLHLNILYARV